MEISKTMMINDILRVDEGIANILMASGMHCLGCIMAHGENLAQACAVHGIDAGELEARINAYLAEK